MGLARNYHGKTALVLAGGGLTGAVYEIGALRAIEDLLVDRTVNDFDIFVGTSAGALVSSMLANGLSPEDMLQVLAGKHAEVPPIMPEDIFHLSLKEVARRGFRFPRVLARALSDYVRNFEEATLFDLVWALGDGLPPGFYDNRGIERYVRDALGDRMCCNDFRELARELYIIATDLDSGDRAVFSRHDNGHVPISKAVQASTALPILYQPVRIDGHDYIDGGMRGTASLDLAIEQGARLIVCINPLVPFDNNSREATPFMGPKGGYLSDKGISAIGAQVIRILTHSGLHYHIKQLRRSHPHVDIVLIEPRRDDYEMFFHNIMHYSARLTVAQHGFESVSVQMAEDHLHYQELMARHGIRISRQLVMNELEEIRAAEYEPAVISQVLERRGVRTRMSLAPRSGRSLRGLRNTLADLEQTLDELGHGRLRPNGQDPAGLDD